MILDIAAYIAKIETDILALTSPFLPLICSRSLDVGDSYSSLGPLDFLISRNSSPLHFELEKTPCALTLPFALQLL